MKQINYKYHQSVHESLLKFLLVTVFKKRKCYIYYSYLVLHNVGY